MTVRIKIVSGAIHYYRILWGKPVELMYLIAASGEHYDFRKLRTFKGYFRDFNKTII